MKENEELIRRFSHEVRTPLNAIIGLSYLSKESQGVPEKIYENLDKIEQSAQYLLTFMNDFLSLSDLKGGKIALEYDSVEIEAYLEKLVAKMQKMADEKPVNLVVKISEEVSGVYVFDKKRLSDALMNLFVNSLKATPSGGGTVVIEAKVLSEDEEYSELQFTITDNGIGIEEELLEKTFDPFEQVYGDSRTLYNGSGLELAITKNIVELMNGKISVASKKGEFTTFSVNVNLKRERRAQKRPKDMGDDKKVSYDFTGKRALIVEDSNINIEIAKNILIHKNFEVEVALNGEEAVNMFRDHEVGYYDVILMDIRMPIMDGLEATRTIREMADREDGKQIPIIAMTANAFEEDVQKSLDAGMNCHLSKPIDIKKMYAMLDEVLNEA